MSDGPNNRIIMLVGDFGSGKTELAVSMARKYAAAGEKVAIVDLDLIKPYFRTRESRLLMEQEGIWVVAPTGGLAHADLPILPSQLQQVLEQHDTKVIIDVGGAEGALVLGQLRRMLDKREYQCLFVVNTFRPFTNDAISIGHMLDKVQQAGRVEVSALISNSNLAQDTTIEDVKKGYEIVRQYAQQSNLPIRWVVVPTWLKNEIPAELQEVAYVLDPVTQYPWMD
jgi:RecA/RadA recombinase